VRSVVVPRQGDLAGEVAVTMPVRVVPSRIKTVACGPEDGLFEHDARKNSVARICPAKMVRPMRAHALEVLNAE